MASGSRVRPAFRSCHACRLRKVRCIYPEDQEKTCERCRDAGVQCIPATKTTRKSNWRRSVNEAIAQRSPTDGTSNLPGVGQGDQPPLASLQNLPSYIKPLPSRLTASAITYLQEGQSFTIPDDRIRDTILESYFEFYHPSMPIVDPREFANSINGNSGQLSLLLLQSMLFIASTYLDSSVLRELGLRTNKEARKMFFDRARLLHEFDCEEDPYISTQALLIISNWYEPTDRKEGSYWLGCAISAMQRLPPSIFSTSLAHKKLWWCVYTRDRSLTWSSRRPLRLFPGNYDLEELSLEDFFDKDDSRYIKNSEEWQDSALACMELIKLYTTISNLILSKTMMRAAVSKDDTPNSTTALFIEHVKWPSQLPENLKYHPLSMEMPRSRCLTVQISMMHIIYWSSLIEFCEILPPNFELPAQITSENITYPPDLLIFAIRVVQAIFQHLKDKNYLTYLPLAGVVVLSHCIAPLIRQVEALPSLSSFTLSRCLIDLMDVSNCFRSTYTIAELVFKVFCLGLRQNILRDPTLVLFFDATDLSGWTLSNPDSTTEIDKLYNNIRSLLLRLNVQDSDGSLPIDSYYTPESCGSGSGYISSSTPQQKLATRPSTSAGMTQASSSEVDPDASLSELQQQSSYQTSNIYGDNEQDPTAEKNPLEEDFDTRDLMSTREFDEFCHQFGLNGAEWG